MAPAKQMKKSIARPACNKGANPQQAGKNRLFCPVTVPDRRHRRTKLVRPHHDTSLSARSRSSQTGQPGSSSNNPLPAKEKTRMARFLLNPISIRFQPFRETLK
jgi:hypothetical protein